ncbi:MAG: hypothetical protein HY043_17355 [Verrucomicrobia bacterium]|nr:hypothetical protein [Verrucomicrobiota bacterium]
MNISKLIAAALVVVCLLGNGGFSRSNSARAAGAESLSSGDVVNMLVSQLCDALTPAQKKFVSDEPLLVEKAITPYAKPVEFMRDNKPVAGVAISESFVTLANCVAYARAKGSSQKGFFDQFSAALAKESGDRPLAEPAGLAERSQWPLKLTNEQLTQFNQIVAAVVAIDLAHHYLGHYQKYKSRLTDGEGRPVPINSLLTPDEWEDAAIAGALNALDCSIATDGLRTLFECIEKMPQRPAWTLYFMPEKFDRTRLNRDLAKLEKGFFRGRR